MYWTVVLIFLFCESCKIKFSLGHIKLILSFSSSPAPDFSARVGQHEYQMGGVWGRVLASRDQIDTSLRSLYIAGTINR